MTITVERDPRTREILIRGPDFVTAVEDNLIAPQLLGRFQLMLNEVWEAGHVAAMRTYAEANRGKK